MSEYNRRPLHLQIGGHYEWYESPSKQLWPYLDWSHFLSWFSNFEGSFPQCSSMVTRWDLCKLSFTADLFFRGGVLSKFLFMCKVGEITLSHSNLVIQQQELPFLHLVLVIALPIALDKSRQGVYILPDWIQDDCLHPAVFLYIV